MDFSARRKPLPTAVHASVGRRPAYGHGLHIGRWRTFNHARPCSRRSPAGGRSLNVRPQGALPAGNLPFVREEQVRAGDSLRSLVQRLGAGSEATREDLLTEIRTRNGGSQLRVGEPANVVIGPSGDLLSLTLPIGPGAEGYGSNAEPMGSMSSRKTRVCRTAWRCGAASSPRHYLPRPTPPTSLIRSPTN